MSSHAELNSVESKLHFAGRRTSTTNQETAALAMLPAVERIWILAAFRGSVQNYAGTHNLKVRGSNPLPATKLRR
jgi:hypothetical protein